MISLRSLDSQIKEVCNNLVSGKRAGEKFALLQQWSMEPNLHYNFVGWLQLVDLMSQWIKKLKTKYFCGPKKELKTDKEINLEQIIMDNWIVINTPG